MDKSAPAEPVTTHWMSRLRDRLCEQERLGLARTLRACPEGCIDLSSNDYLNLRRHPALAKAAARAAAEFASGAGASRLISGDSELHQQFEARFSAFKGAESALIFPSGFVANLALLGALVQPGDLVLADKLVHASLIDAARLSTAVAGDSAVFRTFPHRNVDRARDLARRHIARRLDATVWLLTDTIFSMDGDLADLPALAQLRDEINASPDDAACCLVIDEAHATGVLGETGAGLDECTGHRADISVSTLSKALGAAGGVIAGPIEVTRAVVNFGRAFIYTTGVAPPVVASANAALDLLGADAWRRTRLALLIEDTRRKLAQLGWLDAEQASSPTPIIPLITGSAESAMRLAGELEAGGFFAPAIRSPTVAPGAERVRIALSAEIPDDAIARLLDTLASCEDRCRAAR